MSKKIDEPEKIVIPQSVADWLEVCKENLAIGLFVAMTPGALKANNQSAETIHWLESARNQETLAKAWLYGYEIEEEKLYVAKLKFSGEYLNSECGKKYMMGSTTKNFVKELNSYQHTQEVLEELDIWNNPAFEIKEVELLEY